MNREVRRLLALVVPLLFVTACSGGHGGSSPADPSFIPGAGHARTVRDVTPADLHAGGTSSLGLGLSGGVQPVGLASNIQQPLPSTTSVLGNYGGTANVYYCQTQDVFAKQSFIGANPTAATGPCAPLGSPSTGLGGRVDPVDFVGATEAVTQADYTTYKADREPATGTNFGEPFEAPVSGSAIAFAYKPTDFPGLAGNRLKLSVWSYCAIANGTVTDWNDAAITADNGGTSVTGGTSLPIAFKFRSDVDGINLNLQRHLKTMCAAFFAVPKYNTAPYQGTGRDATWHGSTPSSTWTGPTTGGFTGVATNALLQQTIQQGHGALGYVEAQGIPISGKPHLSAALLQNAADFVSSTPGTTFADPLVQTSVQDAFSNVGSFAIIKGGAGDFTNFLAFPKTLGTTRPECVLYLWSDFYVIPTKADAYPIVEVQYLAFVGAHNGHLADSQTLLSYITSGGADTQLVADGYATMPASVKTAVANAATGAGGKTPCVQ